MTYLLSFLEVAAGTHILRQTIKSFTPATCQTTMLVDIAAYDCFPALAALEDIFQLPRGLGTDDVIDSD